mmetsp:Transcript_70652/g.197387  ORF Transcript_70652/g.197387 Transcript_70652/m.197387 type:complete len:447 (-) Transcript_70652:468-1808(-)
MKKALATNKMRRIMMTDQQEQGVSGVGEAIMGAVTCTDDNCGDGGGGVEEPQGGGGIRVPSSMSALSAAQYELRKVDTSKISGNKLRKFYEQQNALIDVLISTLGKAGLAAGAQGEDQQSLVGSGLENDEEGGEAGEKRETNSEGSKAVALAMILSFGTNVGLLILKTYVAISTGSVTLLASAADSLLDIFSGAVLFFTERVAHQPFDPMKFPEGRTRIEPIGVIVFATIMFMSSLQIMFEAIKVLAEGERELDITMTAYAIIFVTIVSKFLLMVYCRGVLAAVGDNGPVEAYAQDHMNDVITNTGSAIAVVLATKVPSLWWMDSVGAGMIAVYIMASWVETGKGQVEQLTGRTADTSFISTLTHIAANHDERIVAVDTVRAYYFGARYLVEIHICLDQNMTLRECHDIGESLEVSIEQDEQVERCFIHLDWETDHKPEYNRRLNQ